MKKSCRFIPILTLCLLLAGAPLPAQASIEDTLGEVGVTSLSLGHLLLGYQRYDSDGNLTAVRPYGEAVSGPVVDFAAIWVDDETHLRFDGFYENEKDYLGEAHYDRGGHLRLSLLNESLWHRLDHLPLPDVSGSAIVAVDTSPDHDDALQFRQQDVLLRLLSPNMATHLSLRYHRGLLDGSRQYTYLENLLTLNSLARTVDQTTDEYGAILDTHLGAIDLALDYTERFYNNRAEEAPGSLPDNRYRYTVLKGHNSLAGGLVFAGAVGLGQRHSEGDGGTADILKAAGDASWVPTPKLRFAFRYRLTAVDRDSGDSSSDSTGVDVRKAGCATVVSFVPNNYWTVRGGYQHDEIRRDHVDSDGFWQLPEAEAIDRLSLDLQFRPMVRNTTRLELSYLYQHSSDPAYAMSSEETQRLTFKAKAQPGKDYGLVATLRGEDGKSGGANSSFSGHDITFDRQSRKADAALNLWYRPIDRVTVGGNFGYADSLVEQDLLFGYYGGTPALARDLESRQIVRNAALNLNVGITDTFSVSGDLHHIRGSYHYSPDFYSFSDDPLPPGIDSSLLSEISAIEMVQKGFSAGFSWEARPRVNLGLRYLYDDYDDQKNDRLDGSVQSCMLTLAANW